MFSIFKRQKKNLSFIFYINDHSVDVIISEVSASPKKIIYSYNQDAGLAAHERHNLTELTGLLTKISQHFHKKGFEELRKVCGIDFIIESIQCVFAPSWYKSETKNICHKENKEFDITASYINTLVQKELSEYKKSVQDEKYEKKYGSLVKVLEQTIIHTKLNGYLISNIVGKKAHEIEFTLFISFISKQILEKVDQSLHKLFNVRTIKYHSYDFIVANNTEITQKQPLLISISENTTHLLGIDRNIITYSELFPIGTRYLLTEVSKALKVSLDVAASFIAMSESGTVEAGFSKKLTAAQKNVQEEWQAQYAKLLTEYTKHYPLPQNILIVVNDHFESFFNSMISQPLPNEFNITTKQLTVEHTNPLELIINSIVL